MAAPGEEVCGYGVFHGVAPFLQQSHIPGQGGRVAGYIHDPPGSEPVQSFDGVGVQALSGRVDHHHIRVDALLFQRQSRFAGVTAEKFRVLNAVAPGVVPGVLHRLGDHFDANDLARGPGHGQGDGTYTAVKIQHRVVFGDLRLGDGGLVQPLGLVVIDLVEGPGASLLPKCRRRASRWPSWTPT